MSIQAEQEWSGEPIVIDNAGVSPGGSFSIGVDTERTHVIAVARLVVTADTLDKPTADQAITAATATFGVTASSVRCGQVMSATGDAAGCDGLVVTLPPGKDDKHLSVTARSGNGLVGVSLAQATLGELDLHGSRGSIDVAVPTTKGAVITVVAETGDDVVLRLPREFSADVVTLDTGGAVDTAAFPDVQSGKGRGTAGAGAKSITVRSARTGGANGVGGRIVLLAQ